MNALHSVRVCTLLVAGTLMGPLLGVNALAQVGISSRAEQVSLVVRAPSQASMPAVNTHRVIGRRGDLSEAAVRIHTVANSGYRLVARGNAGATSRVWIHMADDVYQELVPGGTVTLPAAPRGTSVQEVRYLTNAKASPAELPVRFELAMDPVI